jgi:tripartite-type tricarboxylate transporter receptor subunit TctC
MSTWVTNDIWEKNIKKFEWDSFSEVATYGKSPLVIVAHPSSKVYTPIDLVKYLMTADKPINVAIGGGAHRMAFEYIMIKTGASRKYIQTIKYNGPLQAVTAVASGAGQEFGIMPIAIAKPLVDAGKVRPIALTGTRKMPQMPGVPLLADVLPGVNVYGAWALILPPKAPKDIQDWYVREFVKAIKSKEYQDWCYDQLIFTEDSELNPKGVRAQMKYLRDTFLPTAPYLNAEGN